MTTPPPDRNVLAAILHDLAGFVELLLKLVSDDAMSEAAFGFSVDIGAPANVTAISDALRSAANPDADLEQYAAAAARLAELTDLVTLAVQAAQSDLPVGAAAEEVAGLVFETAASTYLSGRHPNLLYFAELLEVVTDNHVWGVLGTQLKALWDGLTALDTDDDARLASRYLAGVGLLAAYTPLLVDKVFHRTIDPFSFRVLQGWESDPSSLTPTADRISERFVTIKLTLHGEQENSSGTATSEEEAVLVATLALVPREHGGPGFWLSLGLGGEVDLHLGSGWHFVVEGELADGLDLYLRTIADGQTASFVDVGAAVGGTLEIRLERRDEGTVSSPDSGRTTTPAAPWRIGSFLEVKTVELKLAVGEKDPVFAGVLRVRDGAITIPRADHGFLHYLVPDGGYRLEFDLGLLVDSTPQWSLEGGAGLEVTIPVHTSSRQLQGLHLYLALRNRKEGESEDDPELTFEASAGFGLRLGAFSATVDRLGVVLPRAPHGLSGAPWLKLPTAVGIGIDATGITGGGFLLFDPEHGRYAGMLSLKFSGWTIAAFALITDLPDGYSLLIVASIEWPTPITGPFGIGIKGIGGILGHNHGADVAVLQASMRTGAVSTILFPRDPNAAAPKVLTTLGNVFPVRPGSSLIGLGLKLTWSGGLVSLVAALVIESGPTPRVVILAALEVVAPDHEAPAVAIRIDAVGVFDGTRPSVEIDGSLHDSYIGKFALTGDGALRFHGGDDGLFLVTVGGFHPSYIPPVTANLPPLRRLTLALPSTNPRLRLESYCAVTSNSIQLGAKLEVSARAGGFSAEALLSFDGLVERHPFHLVVDIQGRAAIRYHDSTLASVGLDLHVEGPSPWHVNGKASLSLLFFSVSVPIHYSSGEERTESITQADVSALLTAALADPSTWETTRPVGAVALRAPALDGPAAHPAGRLGVRQSTVPLGVDLTHLGAAAITPDRFDITTVTVNGTAATVSSVRAPFAAGEFVDLTADEMLSRPAFEPFTAGFTAGGDTVRPGPAAPADLTYEEIVLGPDGPLDDDPPRRGALTLLVTHGASFGAAASSPIRREETAQRLRLEPLISVSNATSVLVDAVTLAPVPTSPSGVTATELRQLRVPGQLVVQAHEAAG